MASAADEFLKTVLRSGLLAKAEVQTALGNVPVANLQDAQAIADQFVQLGLLTQFQATKLLQGASVGLQLGPYRILTPMTLSCFTLLAETAWIPGAISLRTSWSISRP